MEFIIQQFWLIRKLGFRAYARYRLATHGKMVNLMISGHNIFVRKGTPDLDVAFACFQGEFDIVKHLFPADFSGVIVDAGAYIGTASIALKSIFPNSKLIAIEPSDENLVVLNENLSSFDGIRIVYGALVGTEENHIQLKNRGTGEWGFTVVASPNDKPGATHLQETPALRLSDLVDEDEKISLLKLDIEGGELSLLEHDVQTMKNIDVVFAELHDRIAPGCTEKFFDFSVGRILIKDKGEKYLSIRR